MEPFATTFMMIFLQLEWFWIYFRWLLMQFLAGICQIERAFFLLDSWLISTSIYSRKKLTNFHVDLHRSIEYTRQSHVVLVNSTFHYSKRRFSMRSRNCVLCNMHQPPISSTFNTFNIILFSFTLSISSHCQHHSFFTSFLVRYLSVFIDFLYFHLFL